MALTDKQLLGKWLNQNIVARQFNGKWFATQSTSDGGFVVRGRAIAQNVDFVKEAGVTDADIATLETSDGYGTQQPLSFETPTGYVKTVKGGATVYYPQALVDQNPTLVEDAAAGGGTPNQSADTFFAKIWAWIQANPLQSVIIAIVTYAVIIEPFVLGKKGKKSLLGKIF